MACLAFDNVPAMFPNVHFGIFIFDVWICSAGDFPRGQMPPRKSQKLQAVSGKHGVTDGALLEILKVLRACPSILDDVYSRRIIERAAHDFLDEVGADIVLPTDDGKGFVWRTAPLHKSLPAFIQKSDAFAGLMRSTMRRLPLNHVWRLVLYADDVTPGNMLRPASIANDKIKMKQKIKQLKHQTIRQTNNKTNNNT